MILKWLYPSSLSSIAINVTPSRTTKYPNLSLRSTTLKNVAISCSKARTDDNIKESKKSYKGTFPSPTTFCPCCVTRRRLIEAFGNALLFPIAPNSFAANDPMDMLNRIHPPRPDWYEELFASVMETGMKAYEAEIAGYKLPLFSNLRGKADKILEIGIGTGPNLKYYADEPGVEVFGVDPNKKMEKYARAAADAAGLPSTKFKFLPAVAEAIPLADESVDAVVGTLVLCSVKDLDLTLQEIKRVLKPGGLYVFVEHVSADDGTIRRFMQGVLDPLQQIVADGCHLTRKTGAIIGKAGFSDVELNQAFLTTASIINPHVYGIAHK
ncbi:OLC1v1032754C1 [Oldenlandia corymbosa var. corymbosa]|uniref:OLC1v1032754C1 n=1 Tax=Oldenlandia corymbosa var. corymbosa TaxID=529605 RepID=A0AAV1CN46_OLDCO|nr:OLC1v1032754C1 [Oldenlandia corymbosa var. corymbosa]